MEDAAPILDLTQYRPNVGVVLFDRRGLAWLGRRAGTRGPFNWQFPQGGVDDGEDLEAAARSVSLLGRTHDWICYDFPAGWTGSKAQKGWRGQKQMWFAFRFEGWDREVDLNAEQPPEILHMALVRARFCELGARLGGLDPDEQYLLGMMSLLPAMMRQPMEKLAPELPLRDEIRRALLGEDNRERCLLGWIERHERNDQAASNEMAEGHGLIQQRLVQFFIDAVVWDASGRRPVA